MQIHIETNDELFSISFFLLSLLIFNKIKWYFRLWILIILSKIIERIVNKSEIYLSFSLSLSLKGANIFKNKIILEKSLCKKIFPRMNDLKGLILNYSTTNWEFIILDNWIECSNSIKINEDGYRFTKDRLRATASNRPSFD